MEGAEAKKETSGTSREGSGASRGGSGAGKELIIIIMFISIKISTTVYINSNRKGSKDDASDKIS